MRATVLAGIVLALGLAAVPAAAGGTRPAWVELFDGRSTAGWRMTGPGSFTVEAGALVTHGGMGLLWYERRRFRDFELQVDWRVGHRCDKSGIYVRFRIVPPRRWTRLPAATRCRSTTAIRTGSGSRPARSTTSRPRGASSHGRRARGTGA